MSRCPARAQKLAILVARGGSVLLVLFATGVRALIVALKASSLPGLGYE
jgi:hypothetical protein